MKLKKFIAISFCIFTIICSAIFSYGCGSNNGECNFSLSEISQVSYYSVGIYPSESGTITASESASYVQTCYNIAKNIKFTKSIQTDIMGNEIHYNAPSSYYTVSFSLTSGSSWSVYVYGNTFYSQKGWEYHASNCGPLVNTIKSGVNSQNN